MRLPTVNQLKMQNQVLSAQYEQLFRLQTQASSGKKLISSSDSPFLSDQIKSTKNYLNQLKSYDLSLTMAEQRTNQKDSIITQSIDLTGRASQLILNAQNDTLNNSDRVVIANELEGILNQLYGLANTRDANDEYIFSGFNVKTPPFDKRGDDYVYQGSSELMQIDISPTMRINYTESGYEVFGNISESSSLVTAKANALLNTGTGVISDSLVNDRALYIDDQYTISLVTNSQGKQGYVVTGANLGQVVPPLPLSVPDDAPEFTPGETIVFNGISLIVSGNPNEGDSFNVSSSQPKNIFSTLSQVIHELKTPLTTDKSKADHKQNMINLSQTVQQSNIHFLEYQTQLGNLGNNIDNQKLLTEGMVSNQEIVLGKFSDADLLTVLSDLTKQMTIIQLTQETYMKIQQSLFSISSKG